MGGGGGQRGCMHVCVGVNMHVCVSGGGGGWSRWVEGGGQRGCMHVCEFVNMHVCVSGGGGGWSRWVEGGGRGVVCMCVRV